MCFCLKGGLGGVESNIMHPIIQRWGGRRRRALGIDGLQKSHCFKFTVRGTRGASNVGMCVVGGGVTKSSSMREGLGV